MDNTLQELKRAHLQGTDPLATAQYIAMLERVVGGVTEFPDRLTDKNKYVRANQCLDCGTTILSLRQHDFVTCECWSNGEEPSGCFIDGGFEYGRAGAADFNRVRTVRIKIS